MRKLVIAGTISLDLAITLHRVQPARQAIHFFRFDTERGGQCHCVLRAGRGAQDAENFLAAGDGIGKLAQKYIRVNCYSSATPGELPDALLEYRWPGYGTAQHALV